LRRDILQTSRSDTIANNTLYCALRQRPAILAQKKMIGGGCLRPDIQVIGQSLVNFARQWQRPHFGVIGLAPADNISARVGKNDILSLQFNNLAHP